MDKEGMQVSCTLNVVVLSGQKEIWTNILQKE